jgi:hypothetical protein
VYQYKLIVLLGSGQFSMSLERTVTATCGTTEASLTIEASCDDAEDIPEAFLVDKDFRVILIRKINFSSRSSRFI